MFRRNILFLLIFLLINICCQYPDHTVFNVTGSGSNTFSLTANETKLEIAISNFTTTYVKLKVSGVGLSSIVNGDIYVGKELSNNPTDPNTLITLSGQNKNYVYVPKADVLSSEEATEGTFFVTIHGVDSNYKLTFTFEDTIVIKPTEPYAFISSDKVNVNVFRYDVDQTIHNFFVIGTTENDVEFESLVYVYGEEQENLTSVVEVKNNVFYNGFVVKADVSDKTTDGAHYLLTVRTIPNSYIRVGIEVVDLDEPMILKDGLTFNGYITNSFKCFVVPTTIGNIRMISKSGMRSYIADLEGSDEREFEQTISETGYQYVEPGEISKKFCIEPLPGETSADYEIQYLDTVNTLIELNPLISGLSYEFNLTTGSYQTYQYKHHAEPNKLVGYNVREIEGHVDVRILSVNDYPITVISEDVLANAEKVVDLNGYFLKHTNYRGNNVWSNEQDILVVQCLDNEFNENYCRFEIAFVGEDESFVLKSNLRYLQYVPYKSAAQYEFSIKENNVMKILIELSKITGDAIMNITKTDSELPNDVQIYYIGNKKVYEITSEQEDCADVKGNYELTIQSTQGSVYSISYFLYKKSETEAEDISEIDIDGGMQILEYLGKGRSQVYKMQNLHKTLQIPYVVNFLPINCEVNISFKLGEEEAQELAMTDHYVQHEITKEMSEVYESDDYYYTITAVNMEHNSALNYEGEMCMVQITSTSLDPQAEMIINEGTPTDFNFTQTTRNVSYVFPHIPSHQHLIARIGAEIDTEFMITYTINGNAMQPIQIAKSGYIVVRNDDIYNYCLTDSICPVVFNITAMNEDDLNEGVHMEFMVKSTNSSTPSYLKKFKVREDVIYSGIKQYFMTDIGPNEKGSVIVNFNKGSGFLLTKFVEKGTDGDDVTADWNGRITFPSNVDPDTLFTFNNITGEFKFDRAQTEKCQKGCELYITVVPFETNLPETIDEFTIYVNSEYDEPKPVDAPLNSYIHGNMYQEGQVKYYTFNVPRKVEEINIEFETDDCKMYLGEGKDLPALGEPSIELFNEASDRVYHIASSTTSSKLYTAAVKCDNIARISHSIFIFRVRTVKTNHKEIIDVKSNHELLCEVKNNYCHYVIPVNPGEYNGSISLFAWEMDSISYHLKMYSRVISKAAYDAMPQSERENNLPTINNYEETSESNMIPELLDVPLTLEEPLYVLLSIYSEDPTQVLLLHADRGLLSNFELVHYASKLIRVSPESEITISVPKEIGATIYAYTVTGKAKFQINNEHTYDTIGYRKTLEFNKQSTDEIEIKVINNDNTPFIFFAWYQEHADGNNLNEVELGTQANYIYNNADFPLVIFMKYWEAEDITSNFYFSNLIKEVTSEDSTDDLQIDTYVINQEKLIELKQNTSAQLDHPITSQVIKHTNGNVIQVTTYAENIPIDEERMNYFLYVINKHSSNTNVYKHFEVTSSNFGSQNTAMMFPSDKYFYDHLKTSKNFNIYHFTKQQDSDEYITIEFSAINDNIVHYVTNQDIPIDETVTQQGTDLQCDYKFIGGKYIYRCNFNEVGDSLFLAVYALETDTIEDYRKYVFRYTIDQPLIDYTVNNDLTAEQEGDVETNIKVTFKPILLNGEYKDATYYVKVYHVEKRTEQELFGRIIEPKVAPTHIESVSTSSSTILDTIDVSLVGIQEGVNYITIMAYIEETQEWIAFGDMEYTVGGGEGDFAYNKIYTYLRSEFEDQVSIIFQAPKEGDIVFSIKTYNFKYLSTVKTLDYFDAEANYLTEEEKTALEAGEYIRPVGIHGDQYVHDHHILFKMPNNPDTKYIYLTLQQEERNENEYEDFSIDILAYNPSKLNKINVPTNRYYIGELESTQVNYYHVSITEGFKYLTVDVIEQETNTVTIEFKNAQTQETITSQVLESQTSKRAFVFSEAPIDITVVVTNTADHLSHYMIKFVLTAEQYNNEPSFDKGLTGVQAANILQLTFGLLDTTKYTKVLYNTEITENRWDETASSLFYDSNEANRNTLSSEYDWIEQTESTQYEKNVRLPLDNGLQIYVYINVFAEDSVTGEEIRANYTVLSHTVDATTVDMIPFDTYSTFTFTPNNVQFVLIPKPMHDEYSFLFKFDKEVEKTEFNASFAFVSNEFVFDYYKDKTIGNVVRHNATLHKEDKAAFINMKNSHDYGYIAVFTQQSNIICEGVVFQANDESAKFKLPQKKYFIDGFNERMVKVYGLEHNNNTHTQLEIEYSRKYLKSLFEFTVLVNDTQELECEEIQYTGKNVLLCNITEFDDLKFKINLEAVFFGGASQAVIFKYKTLGPNEKSSPFTCDTSINVYLSGNNYFVSIIKPTINADLSYIIKMFNQSGGVDTYEIDTIYDSIPSEVTGSFNYPDQRTIVTTNSTSELPQVNLYTKEQRDYFVVVTAYYTDSNNEEHKSNFEIYTFTTRTIVCDEIPFGKYNVTNLLEYKGNKAAFYANINGFNSYVTVHLKFSNVKYSKESSKFNNRFKVDGYITDSNFISEREKDETIVPDSTRIEGEHYLFEHEIILKFTNVNKDSIIFFEIYLDPKLEGDLYYETLTLTMGVFGQNHLIPLEYGDHHVNMLDDNKQSTTYEVNVPNDNTNAIYIEYGERYNSKKIELTVSTDSHQVETDFEMEIFSLPGKRGVIINNITKPLYLTFTNTKASLVEYFVKVLKDTNETLHNYITYNTELTFNLIKKTVSFENILSKVNRIADTGYTSIEYKVVLFNKDENDDGNAEDLENLFLNKVGDEPKFYGFEAIEELTFGPVTKDIETITIELNDLIKRGKKYFIQVTYHSESLITSNDEMHRFAYTNLAAQLPPYQLHEINLEDVQPICFDSHIDVFGFYFNFTNTREIAPQIGFRYYGADYNGIQISSDIFNIHGYTVDQKFIDDKKVNSETQVTQTGIEAKYLIEDNLAFISFEELDKKDYVFVDFSRGDDNNNEYKHICFEIIPENSNVILESTTYYYNKLLPEKNLTFRLDKETPEQKYLSIEVIKNSPEINIEIVLEEEVTETPDENPFIIEEIKIDNLKSQFNIDVSVSNSLIYLLHIAKESIPSETRSLIEEDDLILVKYNLYEESYPEEITFEKEMNVTRTAKELNITFDNINKENKFNKVTYQLNVFTNETVEQSELETYMIDTTKTKPIYTETKIADASESITLTASLNDETIRNDLYVTLHATIVNEKNETIKMKYNLYTVETDVDPSGPTEPETAGLQWYIYVIIGICVIAVILIVILIAKCRRKRNRGFNIEKIQHSNEMKLIDEARRD